MDRTEKRLEEHRQKEQDATQRERMANTIAIGKVSQPFGWLGNMSPFPVSYEGREWRTAEALFQALRFTDEAVKEEIRSCKSPMAAKMVAKREKNKMVVAPRSDQDLRNMEMILRLKLQQHPTLLLQLRATGDRDIVEDCTARPNESGLFWGAARREGSWVGENHLGKLWMALRADFGPHDG